MGARAITREDLALMLESVVRERSNYLRLPSTARFKGGHEEFARRLATFMTAALNENGYAWAKVPSQGDLLYQILVEAIDMSGGDMRFGLTSEDAGTRTISRLWIAERMLDLLRKTQTAVVKRKRA